MGNFTNFRKVMPIKESEYLKRSPLATLQQNRVITEFFSVGITF